MHSIFKQIESTLRAVLADLDATQTQLRPGADWKKWNTQQIVEHLQLTYSLTERAFEARLAKGRPTRARVSFQQRVGQFYVTTLGIFPKGRPAPQNTQPPAHAEPLSGAEMLVEIHQLLTTLDTLYARAQASFGSARAITHQAMGPLSVHQWRRFHLIHARHHVKQILAIRRSYGI